MRAIARITTHGARSAIFADSSAVVELYADEQERTDSIVTSDLGHIERLITACGQSLFIEVV